MNRKQLRFWRFAIPFLIISLALGPLFEDVLLGFKAFLWFGLFFFVVYWIGGYWTSK